MVKDSPNSALCEVHLQRGIALDQLDAVTKATGQGRCVGGAGQVKGGRGCIHAHDGAHDCRLLAQHGKRDIDRRGRVRSVGTAGQCGEHEDGTLRHVCGVVVVMKQRWRTS